MTTEEKQELYYHKYSERYFRIIKRNTLHGNPSDIYHTISHPKRTADYAKTTHMTDSISDEHLKTLCTKINI